MAAAKEELKLWLAIRLKIARSGWFFADKQR